jgi:hypothetical protein
LQAKILDNHQMTTTAETRVACGNLKQAVESATESLQGLARFINAHEEQWRVELTGQWPDEFALLNRYVRTEVKAPFIFND